MVRNQWQLPKVFLTPYFLPPNLQNMVTMGCEITLAMVNL
jgi:hypothetical protein